MRRRYAWLDLLRGVAALAVLIYHFQPFFPIGPAFRASYVAVDLFFCLSGYVLSYAFGPALRDGLSATAFLRARFVKLWPLHLAATSLGAAYYLTKIALRLPDAPRLRDWLLLSGLGTTWLPNPDSVTEPAGIFPFEPTAWSLSCEIVVSGLFGVALWRLAPRTRWVVGLALLAWTARLSADHGTIDLGSGLDSFLPGLVRSLAEFTLGTAVQASAAPGGRSSAKPFLLFSLVVVGGLVLLPASAPWWVALGVVPATLAMLAAVPAAEPGGRLGWWCRASGRLSYPLYLFHTPVFLWLAALAKLRHLAVEQLGDRFGLVLLTSTIVASLLAIRFVDDPIRRRLRPERRGLVARGGDRPISGGSAPPAALGRSAGG